MMLQQLTRKQFVTLGGALCAPMLAGCATGQENTQETEGEPSEERPTDVQENPQDGLSAQESDLLVLFFSRAGENYNVGMVEEGNTAIIAKMIAAKTGADSFELVPEVPYPESYQECCDVALDEKNRSARPALEALPDLSGYTTVFLGFPVWWSDLPMPVYTAIEALDWQGKIIAPFNTHEGSGDAGMFDTLARVCSDASAAGGLTIRGSVAQNDRVKPKPRWMPGSSSWASRLMVEKQGRGRRGGIVIDVSLALLATALMMRQHFPAMLHQICGALFGILIAIHICQHRAWIASLKQGKLKGKRLVGASLMAAVLACALIMVASGLAMSTWASALGIPAGTGTARALHLPLPHLCCCLTGMHAGLHTKDMGELPLPAVIAWSLLAAMGIWSFAALDFGSCIMAPSASRSSTAPSPLLWALCLHCSCWQGPPYGTSFW